MMAIRGQRVEAERSAPLGSHTTISSGHGPVPRRVGRMRWPSRKAAIAFALGVSLAACSATPSKPDVGSVAGSRSKGYTSIDQLISDSAAVFLATATRRSTVVQLYGVPYTVERVDINSVLAGRDPGPSIELRQLGETGGRVTIEDAPQLLAPGTRYLLFAEPFHFTSTDNTGQWVITGGDAGEFRYDPPSHTAFRLDAASTALPSSITLQELRTGLVQTPLSPGSR